MSAHEEDAGAAASLHELLPLLHAWHVLHLALLALLLALLTISGVRLSHTAMRAHDNRSVDAAGEHDASAAAGAHWVVFHCG